MSRLWTRRAIPVVQGPVSGRPAVGPSARCGSSHAGHPQAGALRHGRIKAVPRLRCGKVCPGRPALRNRILIWTAGSARPVTWEGEDHLLLWESA